MDTSNTLLALTSIFVLGVGAQWLAWRVRLPSILLLLSFGFLAGPVTGFLEPDKLFREQVLFSLVSLSVAVILFEGGLTLRLAELKQTGLLITSLLLVGASITWALTTLGAIWLLGMSLSGALLLGAILVVTGPTVIGPLLSHIRPVGKVATLAKWEGIVIDPIGAMLAVLVYELHPVLQGEVARHALWESLLVPVRTLAVGGVAGVLATAALVIPLRRYWIPDHLHSPVVLMMVVGAFTLSNRLQEESGLVTVTVLGFLLGSQRQVTIKHIIEFKENLSVLLISGLFILLAARLKPEDLGQLGWTSLAFVAWLVLVVRPASVFLATPGLGLRWNERVFLAWLAPRGIVAAAVASVFALKLPAGQGGAQLVPAVFLVIVSTVIIYGLTAGALARRLGLAEKNPQGVLLASAHPGARAIAHALQGAGLRVLLIDTNPSHVSTAHLEGLPASLASALSEDALDYLDLGGIGRFLALTPNDEVNSLACWHFSELFGSAEVYQLPPAPRRTARTETTAHLLGGRLLFDPLLTYDHLDERFARGAVVKRTRLTPEFDYAALKAQHGADAIPLFLVGEAGQLTVITADGTPTPRAGQAVISLVGGSPPAEQPGPAGTDA